MKKIVVIFILSAVLGIGIPGASAAKNVFSSAKTEMLQNNQQHKAYKKKRTRGHVSGSRSGRMQMQQRQGQKHLADDRKVQAVQREEKRHEHK